MEQKLKQLLDQTTDELDWQYIMGKITRWRMAELWEKCFSKMDPDKLAELLDSEEPPVESAELGEIFSCKYDVGRVTWDTMNGRLLRTVLKNAPDMLARKFVTEEAPINPVVGSLASPYGNLIQRGFLISKRPTCRGQRSPKSPISFPTKYPDLSLLPLLHTNDNNTPHDRQVPPDEQPLSTDLIAPSLPPVPVLLPVITTPIKTTEDAINALSVLQKRKRDVQDTRDDKLKRARETVEERYRPQIQQLKNTLFTAHQNETKQIRHQCDQHIKSLEEEATRVRQSISRLTSL